MENELMEELLNSNIKQFREKIANISDSEELNKILHMCKVKENNMAEKTKKEISTFSGTVNDKAILFNKWETEKIRISQKITACERRLESLESNKEELIEDEQRVDKGTFSWGIVQRKEPKTIFKEKRKYRSNNKTKNANIIFSDSGMFIYSDAQDEDIDDLCKGEKSKKDMLNLIKVELQDEETKRAIMGYYVLMSIDKNLNSFLPEDKEAFEKAATTFLSGNYMDKVVEAAKNKKCIYGGKIIGNTNGEVNFNFEDTKQANAVKRANEICGSARTYQGKMSGTLLDIIKVIDTYKEKNFHESPEDGER